jgi:hypothetical protein
MRLLAVVLSLLFVPAVSNADVSMLVLESVGVSGEFTGAGHTAVYLSNICADGPLKLRLCTPGESGVVISAYPKFSDKITQEWMAVPIGAYLYGVDDIRQSPIYTNGEVRRLLRETYRKTHLQTFVEDSPDGTVPKGGWQTMLTMAFNRDIYGFSLKTTPAEDAKFLERFNAMNWQGKFNSFSRNCADFTRKVMNTYFPGATRRDVINDFGITTPKALGKSLTGYASSRPERLFYVTKYSQIAGPIWRSYDNMHFTQKALTSKKYLVPSLYFYPPVFYAMAGAYFLTGRYSVPDTYEKYISAETARLHLERTRLRAAGSKDRAPLDEIRLRIDRERHMHLGNEPIWNAYEERFSKILDRAIEFGLFQDVREVKTYLRDLELMSAPELDENGSVVLQVKYYKNARRLGITRQNILEAGSDRELAYKLMIAKIYSELQAEGKNRESLQDFLTHWDLMDRLTIDGVVSDEMLAYRRGRGRFVEKPPADTTSRKMMKAFLKITK